MNGAKVLLDTNIVLYVLNGDEQVADLIQGCDAFLSVINRVELLSSGKMTAADTSATQAFIRDCKLVQFTQEIQDLTIDLRQRYKLKLADAAVAATASYLGVQLVTADKAFLKLSDEISVLFVER